jgi:hypothetical protein
VKLALRSALAAAAIWAGLAAPAHADDVARRVADANFERPDHRAGWMIGFAFGGGLMVGLGLPEATGVTGGFSFRLGTTAGPNLLWMVQFDTTGYPAKDATLETEINRNTAITLAGQIYLRENLWTKLGLGLATFSRGAERGQAPREQRDGFSALASFGYDAARRGRFVFDIEGLAFACVYENGVEVSAALFTGFNWY